MTPIARLLTHRPTLVALLVAAAFFMENLDGTIIATALPQMAASFSTRPEQLAIGMTAYLLALAVFIPASGWVADRFGARPVFATALVGFTLASIACGASVGVATFTIARILQGAAGALMVPVGRLVVLRGTDRSELMRAIAMLTWPGLTAPILGPPLGGFITHAYSWRWIFFINVPVGLACIALALLLIDDREGEARRPFDLRGFLLNGLGLACLLYALDQLGRPGADWLAAGAWLAVSVAIGGAAVWHARRHTHPLVSLDSFAEPTFASTMKGGFLARIVISTTPFLLPLTFQVGLGRNAFASGLYVLWYGLTNLAIKPFTSGILRRHGFRRVLLVNTVVSAAAIAACALIGTDTPDAVTILVLMVAGASRSMQFTAINALTFAELPPAATGPANTLFNMAFQLAIGMGIAGGAIMLRVTEAALPPSAHAAVVPFHAAFLAIGAIGLLPLIGFLRLVPDAGAAVSGQARHRPLAVDGAADAAAPSR